MSLPVGFWAATSGLAPTRSGYDRAGTAFLCTARF